MNQLARSCSAFFSLIFQLAGYLKTKLTIMIRFSTTLSVLIILLTTRIEAQEIISLDTAHWEINANAYLFEKYKGKDAIYLQGGTLKLKDTKFLNGTIEFDIFLSERRGFPGIEFRNFSPGNMEKFYFRPHMSGKPDANQATPVINGTTPWQFYFGPAYSFPYEYNFDDWTHVKLVVHDRKAQIYLDYSKKPNFSWNLVHQPQEGSVSFGGGFAARYYANFKIDKNAHEIVGFKPSKRKPIAGLVPEWEVSDKFEEKQLENPAQLKQVIEARTWGKTIQVEEGTAANIARQVVLRDGSSGNTVFAKITINSDKDQVKLFEFGYSDRVVAILNDKAIYKGNNSFRSRDYRYLGTIGLFDAIYLDLEKGQNTLLLAVSENFGGWLVTGRFENEDGLKIK